MNLYQYLIGLFLMMNICHAQEYVYQHFGVDDGLPSSQVYDMYQDKQGYIWFATDKGLSRYNGYEFENFTTQQGLFDNVILDFFPQKNGQIWCFGYQNHTLFYFDEVFDGFKKFQYNDSLSKIFNIGSIIKSIHIDEKGSLYFGGININGLIEVTKEGQVISHYEGIVERNVKRNIAIDNTKNVLFTIHGVNESFDDISVLNTSRINSRIKFDILNKEQSIIINDSLWILSADHHKKIRTSHSPINIKRIDDTHFFVGYYNNGAEIRNLSGDILKTFLPTKIVTNFFIDVEGGYWFSTLNNGVFYIKNPNIQVFTKEHVSSLVKGKKNTLYAGFRNGNIIAVHAMEVDTIYKSHNVDRAIVEFDTIHNIFYGYSDTNVIHFKNDILEVGYVRKFPENVGNPLLKSETHSFYMLKNDTIENYKVNYKLQDVCMYNDEVLIGTSNGLFVQRDSIVKVDESLDFLNLRFDDIDVNKKATKAYMASHGAGVVVYGSCIYAIGEEDGLTNNIVSEVHVENDSIIWACTNSGLNRISFKSDDTYTINTITKDDGLLSNDIDDVEIINDTVWVATKEGLCFFKKEMLANYKTSTILSLALKEVRVNAKIVEADHIQLPYHQNNINFFLQAVSHKNATNINYGYRLKEVDTNWTLTKTRNINFPSLPPGSYTFQAKASTFHSKGDNTLSYKFKITPPFWKTWWFYGFCIFIITGIIYLFFKIRVLSYNKDIIRELIRLAIKRLKRKEKFLRFRSNGEDFKIPTHEILYIQSQGNYLDVVTEKRTYTIRCKIGDFIATTPDVLEYLRVHRSYIVRIDQISSKGKNWVVIREEKIPVGKTYLRQLEKIQF